MSMILRKLKPYTILIVIVFIMVSAVAISQLILPDRMSEIIGQGIVVEPKFVPGVGVVMEQHADMAVIWKNGLIMLGITLLASLLNVGVSYLSAKIAGGVSHDIRDELFKKVTAFSLAQEDKFGTASLITRSTNDVTQIQMVTMMAMRMLINIPVMFVGGALMAFGKDPNMARVIFYVIPIAVLIMLTVSQIVVPMFRKMQKKADKLTLVARENITGVRVIRAFGGEEREREKFAKANSDIRDLGIRSARVMSTLMPIMTLLFSGSFLAITFVSVFAMRDIVNAGSRDFSAIGNMMAVTQYVMQMMMSLVLFAMMFIMIPKAAVSAQRINEVLKEKPAITDPKNPTALTAPRGNLEFRNVTFRYKDAGVPVLNNVSFTCKTGQTTAIIGSTGSGKSTIVNLIPRFYDVTDGAILFDGVNLKELKEADIRESIGFAPQKAQLISGTVADNILYGAKDTSQENMEASARVACAYDFIMNKENGFNSVVEQGAANFSGGQKQRLSIARAIAKRPKIFIFDDTFSALDFKTDREVRANLKSCTKDATVIIVGQRIGSIMDADNIIVLKDGEICAQGKHVDLLRSSEEYRDIALSQLSHEELSLETNVGTALCRPSTATEGGK